MQKEVSQAAFAEDASTGYCRLYQPNALLLPLDRVVLAKHKEVTVAWAVVAQCPHWGTYMGVPDGVRIMLSIEPITVSGPRGGRGGGTDGRFSATIVVIANP